jgi:hypothetical protein
MPTRTIETVVKFGEDRRMFVQLPADVPVGTHHLVAIIEEATQELPRLAAEPSAEWTFPVLANAQWPADMRVTTPAPGKSTRRDGPCGTE